MCKPNKDVRQLIRKSGLKYWQVAYEIGLNDGNFSRALRRELDESQKIKIFDAIEKLANERSK